MRRQIFEYKFCKPKVGDKFISYRDLLHALNNSDLFPYDTTRSPETREEAIMHDTIDAVFAAIDATPKYELRERNEITNGKCPLCGKAVKFDGKRWSCKLCSAEGTLKRGELIANSCSV